MEPSKQDWWRKRIDFRNQKRAEENEILKDHNEKWRLKTLELHQECSDDGGHLYEDLPHNGINHPNYATGEWPQACTKCRKWRPNE